jgi:hypothetical protein
VTRVQKKKQAPPWCRQCFSVPSSCLSTRFPHPGTIDIADLAGTLVGCNDRRSDVAGVASRGVRGQSATAAARRP